MGKALVDDVWSGGSKDGKSNVTGVKYKTVSQAIKEGLYHPRCRDSHTTYFEGINTMPAEGYTREELKKLAEDYKGEQQQQQSTHLMRIIRGFIRQGLRSGKILRKNLTMI